MKAPRSSLAYSMSRAERRTGFFSVGCVERFQQLQDYVKSFFVVSRLIGERVERGEGGYCRPTADIMPLLGPVALPILPIYAYNWTEYIFPVGYQDVT